MRTLLALAFVVAASPAVAMTTYGLQTCAVAAVEGHVLDQSDNIGCFGADGCIVDGYWHITFAVDEVLFGQHLPKQMEITRWKKKPLKLGRVRLYMNVGRHGWAICE